MYVLLTDVDVHSRLVELVRSSSALAHAQLPLPRACARLTRLRQVLSIFHPTHRSLQPRNSISQSHLRALPPLRGGEVFAVFRLVGHANAGKPVHIEGKRLIFWQSKSCDTTS